MSILALRARAAAAAFACSGGGICRAATKPASQAVLSEPTALGASMSAARMWPGKATAGASWIAGSGPKASSGATAGCRISSTDAVARSAGSCPKTTSGATAGKPAAPAPASTGPLNTNQGCVSWQAGPKASSGPTAGCRISSTDAVARSAGSCPKTTSGATAGKPAAPAPASSTDAVARSAGSCPKTTSGATAGKPAAPAPASTGPLNTNQGGVSWQAGPKASSGPTAGCRISSTHAVARGAGSSTKTTSGATAGIAIAGGPIGVSWVAGRPNKATPTGFRVLLHKADPKPSSTSAAWICPGKMAGTTPTPAGPVKAVLGTLPNRFMSTSSKDASGKPGAPLRKVLVLLGIGLGLGAAAAVLRYPYESPDQDQGEHADLDEAGELPLFLDWSLMPGFPTIIHPCYNASCGSCWAIVAVKSIESVFSIKRGRSMSLSVQQVIDCAAIEGCRGSNLVIAYNYLKEAGLTTEALYPGPPARFRFFLYGLIRGYCKMNEEKPVAVRISGFQRIHPDEESLMKALQVCPVAVYCVVNDEFGRYRGGILTFDRCPSSRYKKPGEEQGNHCLLVVGYGVDEDGTEYWKLMNTWGSGWGEGGYLRVRRGHASMGGVLGMNEHSGFMPVLSL